MEEASKAPKSIDANPKTRFGAAKPSTFCIPPVSLLMLGAVMNDGAHKYGVLNWRESDVSASTYFDAAMRHLLAWRDGQNIDVDSSQHPLAHVMACCAIVIDAQTEGMLIDDRGKVQGFAEHYIKSNTKA